MRWSDVFGAVDLSGLQTGVGSFAAEFLVRAGVGELTIIDGDDVDPTNRNRQLPALVSTQV